MLRMSVETITPDMAQEYLNCNIPNNRNIDNARVASYARTMVSGQWNLTHQGIAFDESGSLIDGQHRLSAIIRADVPVKMVVVRGVQHNNGELLNIDVGRIRSDANILRISGINDPIRKEMIPTVRSWWYHKRPGYSNPTNAEIQDYITRHYSDLERLYTMARIRRHACGKSKSNTRNIQGVVCAGLLSAIYRGVNDDAITKFCNVYRQNDVSGCESYNVTACLNLRDRVRSGRSSDHTLYLYIESSIRAFANNLLRVKLRSDCFPFDSSDA